MNETRLISIGSGGGTTRPRMDADEEQTSVAPENRLLCCGGSLILFGQQRLLPAGWWLLNASLTGRL